MNHRRTMRLAMNETIEGTMPIMMNDGRKHNPVGNSGCADGFGPIPGS